MAYFRANFEKVREFYASKKATWLAVDIEAWEMDHTVVTECGWSYVRWEGDREISDRGHYIVKENVIYTNGKYVPNARDVSSVSRITQELSWLSSNIRTTNSERARC